MLSHISNLSRAIVQAYLQPTVISLTVITNVLIFGSAFCFYQFEVDVNPQVQSIFDAIWWAYSTITTVGYGDLVPVTFGGKITAIVLMVAGVTVFICFTAVIASLITSNLNLTKVNVSHLEEKIDALTRRLDEEGK